MIIIRYEAQVEFTVPMYHTHDNSGWSEKIIPVEDVVLKEGDSLYVIDKNVYVKTKGDTFLHARMETKFLEINPVIFKKM